MSTSTVKFLEHILAEINFLLEETEYLKFEDFIENEKDKRAYSRSLEIIGEAVKNLPNPIRDKYSNINWKSVAGLRDRLIHGYFNVDYNIIWNVIKNQIPPLKQQIEIIIEDTKE